MSKAVIIEKNGGPEELKLVDVTVGQPGPGEIRIRHKAVGLNFIDVYQRSGLYALPMPLHLGMEASGVIEAVGEGVTHLKVGDRAAYASQPPGSYCEERVMPAKCVCKLPDAISFETGAAMMLKGLTAQYLLKRTLPQGGLHKGDFHLVPRSRRRCGLDRLPMGQGLGLPIDWYGRQRCQVRIGQSQWRSPRHQLQHRRLSCACERNHRWQRRESGLRLGGQRHLGQVTRLLGPLWFDGQLWQRLRRTAHLHPASWVPKARSMSRVKPCSATSSRAKARKKWPTICLKP